MMLRITGKEKQISLCRQCFAAYGVRIRSFRYVLFVDAFAFFEYCTYLDFLQRERFHLTCGTIKFRSTVENPLDFASVLDAVHQIKTAA